MEKFVEWQEVGEMKTACERERAEGERRAEKNVSCCWGMETERNVWEKSLAEKMFLESSASESRDLRLET
jgi:hypothetical protein